MGGGGKQPSSTSSTSEVTTTTVPKYLKPYLTDVATRAQAESRTPYQAYGGQRIAGFTPDQQAALGNIAGMHVARANMMLQASGMFGAHGNLGYGCCVLPCKVWVARVQHARHGHGSSGYWALLELLVRD